METKTYMGGLEIKQDGDQGLVSNEFATLNVIDKDGDVTLPGAFGEQRVRLAAWNHGSWMGGLNALPVGKGQIHEDADKAVFGGEFFLNTETGREHFNTVKGLGDLQEWSYSFNITDSGEGEFEGQQVRFLKRMEVIEVAPVLQGAGIGTRTVDIKAAEDTQGWTYSDHAEHVLASVQAFVERTGSLADLRAKEGRGLPEAHRDRLTGLLGDVAGLKDAIEELLTKTEPEREKALRLFIEFQRTLAGVS